jgi:hypothetical protein
VQFDHRAVTEFLTVGRNVIAGIGTFASVSRVIDCLGVGVYVGWYSASSCPPTNASTAGCGCDGETYDSPCLAQRARTSVYMEGDCVNPTILAPGEDCNSDVDCDEGKYCNLFESDCGLSPWRVGTCNDIPTTCNATAADDWECGCDGEMYRTPCDAARARVSVTTLSRCSNSARPRAHPIA